MLQRQLMKQPKPKILLFLRFVVNTLTFFLAGNSLHHFYGNSEKDFWFYLVAVAGFLVYGVLMYGVFLEYNRIRGGSKGSESVNPVKEADVYIAYGRKEQAIAVLQKALKSDPNNSTIRAKLESLEK